MSGKAAAAVIATEDLEVAGAIQKVFTRGVFRVYLNDDVDRLRDGRGTEERHRHRRRHRRGTRRG